jgi:hypothetical protein
MLATLTPGGFAGESDDQPPKNENDPSVLHHGMAVQGWAELLESMNIPYRIIPEFRLSLKALNGIQILIIPHVTSFEREGLGKTLKPYLARIGTVLMTGTQFGEKRTSNNLLAAQPNLTNDLRAGEPPERFIFMQGNPGAEFHYALMKDQRERYLAVRKVMAQPIDKMIALGIPMEVLQGSPKLSQTSRWVTHTKRGGREFFFDFYNILIDEKTFEATPNDGGKATITVPGAPPGDKLSLRWYSETKNGFVNLSYSRTDDGRIQFTVPSFRYYGSIHLSGIE